MKKVLLFVIILLLSASLFSCTNERNKTQVKEAPQQTDEINKKAVTSLVENFGKKLQMVSLLAPKDLVNESMKENYSDYVSQELLAKWQNDPQNAPGRMVSSPWPDRIEILNIEKISEDTYQVKGEIIEITSVEKVNGGAAAKRHITLSVKNVDNRWLINAVTLDPYEEANSIVYRNTQYGFNFSLPKSWKGYTIVTDKWKGVAVGDSQAEKTAEIGPLIYIRHPDWTSQNPRQDIPIMVFTLTQWNSLQQGKFHIGAAPIGPSELSRNSRYVFALPARYNYAFPTGYEEVENILSGSPLKAIEK